MKQAKGLILSYPNFINSTHRSIFKLEKLLLNDSELSQQIYMLGLYNYRKFHKIDIPKDSRNPRIREETLV